MADLDEIRRVYDMVDENADRLVSLDEIIGFVNKLEMPIFKDDLICMLVGTPQENYSCLRFEEIVHLYHSIFTTHDQDDNNEEEEEDSEDLMEAFKVFYQTNNGYISSTELQQVLSAMGLIPQGHDARQCQKVICRFDSDFNGVLDLCEFKNMMSSKLSP